MRDLYATVERLNLIAREVFNLHPREGEERIVELDSPYLYVSIESRIETRFGGAWCAVSSSTDFNRIMIWDGANEVDISLPGGATDEELKTIMTKARDLYQQIALTAHMPRDKEN